MLTVNAPRWDKGVEARLPARLDTGPLPPAEGPLAQLRSPTALGFRIKNPHMFPKVSAWMNMNMNTFTNLED